MQAALLSVIALLCLGVFFAMLRASSTWRFLRPGICRAPEKSLNATPLSVAAAEYQVEVTDLVRLSVRLDEVWEDRSGALVAVETKSRDRIFYADVVQLSTGAYALRHGSGEFSGHCVSPVGIFRLAPKHKVVRLVTVKLLTDRQIEALVERFVSLRFGLAVPCPTPEEAKCRSCPFGLDRCEDSIA